jgi:uncharacterized protein (TIGR00369 family)
LNDEQSGSVPPTDYDPIAHEPASGFRHLVGYRVAEWSEGRAVMSLTPEPSHLNRGGVVHGGVIASLMDSAGGFCGCWCPIPGRVRRVVTVSLTVNFVAPVREGELRVVGLCRSGGRRTYFAQIDAYDGQGKLVATGQGVYRYARGSEAPEGVPREAFA